MHIHQYVCASSFQIIAVKSPLTLEHVHVCHCDTQISLLSFKATWHTPVILSHSSTAVTAVRIQLRRREIVYVKFVAYCNSPPENLILHV